MFYSPVWATQLECFDNNELLNQIYEIERTHSSEKFSNRGGFQSHNFENSKFKDVILNETPRRVDKKLPPLKINDWVNINRKGDYNCRHVHLCNNVFLSGVYYVKVPENSGNIRFWDPRGILHHRLPEHDYYFDDCQYQWIVPKAGLLLFFPTWLEHEVEPNESDEDRISISFNLSHDNYLDHIESWTW
jgi:uncharacterized protein (TIGR02466 family)